MDQFRTSERCSRVVARVKDLTPSRRGVRSPIAIRLRSFFRQRLLCEKCVDDVTTPTPCLEISWHTSFNMLTPLSLDYF
jgi:hypothetical protein